MNEQGPEPGTDPHDCVSVAEAALMLGISRREVITLADAGAFAIVAHGGRRGVSRADVQAWRDATATLRAGVLVARAEQRAQAESRGFPDFAAAY
jgi:excisionase family DNA binding protein